MNHRVQRTTTTNTKPAALWVCTEIKEDEETERDSQRAMIAPSQKASTSESLEGLVLAFLRSPFYSDQVKTHSMRRHHLPLSRRQHEGPRRPAADDARRTTSAPSSTSTSTAALPADEDVALAPQGDSERRHRDGVDSCVMGLSADEPSLPLLDPVGKAIGASASLLTATPTVSSRPTSAADSTLPATCGRRRSERRHGWRCLAPLSRCVWAACRGESLGVTLVSALNLSLAVSVVVSCKLSYDRARLPNLSLTVVHLAASLAALRTAAAFKVTWAPQTPTSETATGARVSSSASAPVSSFEHWRLAFLLCAFMALPNLSLEFNTAGTSTLLRLLSLPVTAWLQTVVFGRRQRRAAVLSLLPVALGVSMNALGDLRFNPAGLFFGVAGAAAAAFYFLLESQLRRALPALALVALLLEPPWRGPRGLLARQWHPRDAALLVGSSLAGCLLTLTMQWLLGRTSALTYQVLGHVKMCATLLACAVVFDEHLKPVQQAGVFLTLCGAVLYTMFKSRDEPASSSSAGPDHHYHHGNRPLLGSPSTTVK
ncbi:hypothetical protein HPB49_015645 [Dermacentor silvarum]|uniref:Uncharacterized protein n=1 Tax=Dermacentor silvarum TaxID=543639 RepID=A0ACB8CS17_DERSI|nr:hypothetical protein HPB49_015645 [Dermacentor silvarum]